MTRTYYLQIIEPEVAEFIAKEEAKGNSVRQITLGDNGYFVVIEIDDGRPSLIMK